MIKGGFGLMQKNKIKVIGAALFLSSIINLQAMDGLRNVAQVINNYVAYNVSLSFIKDNFFLCATAGATACCGISLYKGCNKSRHEVYKERNIFVYPDQKEYTKIPGVDAEIIRQRIYGMGVKYVEIVQGEFVGTDNEVENPMIFEDTKGIPAVSVLTAGDKACVLFNLTARKMFYGSIDERDQMYAVLEHEYDHIYRRQLEKYLLVGHFVMPMASFFIGAALCKGADVSVEKVLASPRNLLYTAGAICATSYIGLIVNYIVASAYSRSVERAADKAVLATKDRRMLKSLHDFLVMCQTKEKEWAQKYPIESQVWWYEKWFASHPSDEERIETFKKALAELEIK